MVTMPTLIVEIGFTAGPGTEDHLHLGDESRGVIGTNTLAPDEVLTDISQWVRGISTKRGSTRVQGPIVRYEAGTSATLLRNDDRRFDPTNLNGPYVSAGLTQVEPMRVVRHRATWDGETYSLWRGFADDWQIGYNKALTYSEVTLTATDGFKVLAAVDREASSPVGLGENVTARVGRILDSADWPASDRMIADSNSTVHETTLEGNALDELLLVSDTEIGAVFVDGAGRIVFKNRRANMEDATAGTSQATFGDNGGSELPIDGLSIEYDDTTIFNDIRVTAVGGTAQTATDSTSQARYLRHTYERSDVLLLSDGAASNYAQFVLAIAKDPELRFTQLQINPLRDPDALFPHVLAREIGDRITIKLRPPGGGDVISRDVFIRGVSHDVTAETWLTTWGLQSASPWKFLTLDHSTLGVIESTGNILGW